MSTEDQTELMDFPSIAEAHVIFDVLRRIAGAYGELLSLAGWHPDTGLRLVHVWKHGWETTCAGNDRNGPGESGFGHEMHHR